VHFVGPYDYFPIVDYIDYARVFRCAARLVVMMIYDLFICKFSRCNNRCSASVAYPSPYSDIRAILCSFFVWIFCCTTFVESIRVEKTWKLIVSCD
jgi:hypothetical protein